MFPFQVAFPQLCEALSALNLQHPVPPFTPPSPALCSQEGSPGLCQAAAPPSLPVPRTGPSSLPTLSPAPSPTGCSHFLLKSPTGSTGKAEGFCLPHTSKTQLPLISTAMTPPHLGHAGLRGPNADPAQPALHAAAPALPVRLAGLSLTELPATTGTAHISRPCPVATSLHGYQPLGAWACT